MWDFGFGILGFGIFDSFLSHVWFLSFWGRTEKVTHVLVSGVWKGNGKGVTCNGFCGLVRRMGKVPHVCFALHC